MVLPAGIDDTSHLISVERSCPLPPGSSPSTRIVAAEAKLVVGWCWEIVVSVFPAYVVAGAAPFWKARVTVGVVAVGAMDTFVMPFLTMLTFATTAFFVPP